MNPEDSPDGLNVNVDLNVSECEPRIVSKDNKPIVFYDIEACRKTGKVVLWTAIILIAGIVSSQIGTYNAIHFDHNVPIFTGSTIEELRKLICELAQYNYVYVMAFNGNKYDHLYLCDGCKGDVILDGNTFVKGTVQLNKVKIKLKDMLNFISLTTLEKLGKQLKCPKLEPTTDDDIEYCMRDTLILYKAWVEIVIPTWMPVVGILCNDIHNIIKYNSQAAISFNFMISGIKNLYPLCKQSYKWASRAYYGACVDSSVFCRSQKGKIEEMDHKSLYPFGMTNKMPSGKCKFYYKYPAAITASKDRQWSGFDSATLLPFICLCKLIKREVSDFIDLTFGIVPVKDKYQTIYASYGTIVGWYTSVDIENAFDDGWDIEWMKYFFVWPQWSMDLSNNYKNEFNLKEMNPKGTVMYWFHKQNLNSSIGYFAHENLPAYINWFCMSYARKQRAWVKRLFCREQITHYLYSDTDSYWVWSKYASRLQTYCPFIFKGEIGHLSCDTEDDGMIVLGKKTMATRNDKKVSSKGFARITYQDMIDALRRPQVIFNMRPKKRISVLKGTIHSNISEFIEHPRTLQPNIPKYKQLYKQLYVNKIIHKA